MASFIKRFIPWNYRYRRSVPRHHRRLIAVHRLPKPNWFVGSAEQASVPRDPALVREIENAKQRLRDYRVREAAGAAPSRTPTGQVPATDKR